VLDTRRHFQRGHWHSDHEGEVHLSEWAAEAAGTALLMLVIVSVVSFFFGPGSPVQQRLQSTGGRLLLAGLLIAGSGSLVAVSPLGRLSGGHLNPAVTFGFWITGHVHRHDLLGYVAAQVLGAFAGAGLGAVLWGSRASAVHFAATHPGHGFHGSDAAAVEALMTGVLLLVIFVLNASNRTMRLTPLATWLLVATMVWQAAPYTGTSLNPARSLAPAVLDRDPGSLWVYLLAPLVGAAAAAALVQAGALRRPLTAKMFHDSAYPSVMQTIVPTTAGSSSAPG
jgi:aquaporin Z